MNAPSRRNRGSALKGVVTFSVRQSLTSFASSKRELHALGVDIALRWIGVSPIRSFFHDLRFLGGLLARRNDFVILNSGVLYMIRPRLLALALAILKRRNVPVFVLWRNAASKFDEIRRSHGEARFLTAAALMRDPALAHLAISDETARNVRDALGCNLPQNILNCRSMPERYLEPVEPEEPPIVLNVASGIPRKGPDIFTDIAIATCRAQPQVRFCWLGSEAPAAEAEKIEAAGLEDRIVFKPFDPDPFAYMQRASLFLLTSREEGFGLVLAEAMACSRTVLSFAGTGAAEVAGETGLVLPNGDVEATCEAILDILAKPVGERVNHAARERYLALYSPAAYAARLAQVIRARMDGAPIAAD